MKEIKQKKWFTDFGVLVAFIILSVLFTSFFISSGRIALASDGSFHFSRAEELYQNLKSGSFFTFIATHTFHGSGVGTFLFYPTVFIYPWAFLRFLFNPITAFYIWYGVFMFLTLVISYYVMVKFSQNRLRGFVFALFYTVGSYHLYLGIKNYVLGEFIAYTFVPIAMYGFYEVVWGNSKKWPFLAVGCVLLLYSHLLSVVIAVGIMVIIFIITLILGKRLEQARWFALLKSIGLATLLGSWVVYPFISDYLKDELGGPTPGFTWIRSTSVVFDASLKNVASNKGVGLALLVAALIGWYFVKSKTQEKIFYILGIFFLLAVTNIFPYVILWKYNIFPALQVIQFPYRFLTYASFFLAIVVSEIVVKLSSNLSKYHEILLAMAMLLLSFCLYCSAVTPVLERIWNQNPQAKLQNVHDYYASVPSGGIIDKENYQSLFSYVILYGETDYYPKESFSNNDILSNQGAKSIISHEAKVGNQTEQLQAISLPNALLFNIKVTKATTIDLPVVSYASDVVYVDNKKVSFKTSDRGTIKINVKKGTHQIKVQYRMSSLFYVLFGVSLLGWISIFLVWVLRKVKLYCREGTVS
ncbi:MAG: hypothetical protein HDT50_00595 [Lactobacillus sp.]|nr:hypothetical protein [Lactobacillus sp.]